MTSQTLLSLMDRPLTGTTGTCNGERSSKLKAGYRPSNMPRDLVQSVLTTKLTLRNICPFYGFFVDVKNSFKYYINQWIRNKIIQIEIYYVLLDVTFHASRVRVRVSSGAVVFVRSSCKKMYLAYFCIPLRWTLICIPWAFWKLHCGSFWWRQRRWSYKMCGTN